MTISLSDSLKLKTQKISLKVFSGLIFFMFDYYIKSHVHHKEPIVLT